MALYQNVIPHLGPAGKVALLYLGAGTLAGAGVFLERSRQTRENPGLHRYSQVVLAAGLAAVYYVTYAAYYSENLRVLPNSVVAGAALLAWTAFMVFLAHRRDSETLATVGILLAYYASAINEGVATFSLLSNLVLTGGVVFLLRRHLWRVFPFASLLATFGSYAFWTYSRALPGWDGGLLNRAQHGSGGFWIETAFLAVYWALFTWAAFTTDERLLPPWRLAGFVSLNNGAFYVLVTWLVLGQGSSGFWKWSLGFGAVLLVLAEVDRRRAHGADARTQETYRLQGVGLMTVGLIAYFDGWHLALALALEAAFLLQAATFRRSRSLLVASVGSALLAFGWMLAGSHDPLSVESWALPLGVGALFVGTAYLAQRWLDRAPVDGASTAFRWLLSLVPTLDALLGSVVWLLLIDQQAPSVELRVGLDVAGALALTAAGPALRVWALPVYAQGYLITAVLAWLNADPSSYGKEGDNATGWSTLTLLVGIAVLGQAWRRFSGRLGQGGRTLARLVGAVDAMMVVGVAWLDLTWRVDRWHSGSVTLAAAWSVLAATVFAVGWLLRERAYRWLALAVMAVTLGHIVWFDLARLDSLGKAISIFALALVFLGVSLLYNRYREKFRDLL